MTTCLNPTVYLTNGCLASPEKSLSGVGCDCESLNFGHEIGSRIEQVKVKDDVHFVESDIHNSLKCLVSMQRLNINMGAGREKLDFQ